MVWSLGCSSFDMFTFLWKQSRMKRKRGDPGPNKYSQLWTSVWCVPVCIDISKPRDIHRRTNRCCRLERWPDDITWCNYLFRNTRNKLYFVLVRSGLNKALKSLQVNKMGFNKLDECCACGWTGVRLQYFIVFDFEMVLKVYDPVTFRSQCLD